MNRGAIWVLKDFLYQPLAEGASSDDDSCIVILHRPADDLRSRCRGLVDQDIQGVAHQTAIAATEVLLPRIVSTLDVDDRLILGEHLIDHPQSRLKDPPGIISQVKHKTLHTALLQLSKCLHKVVVRA